ncbi:MAG: hypothetical protein JO325_18270, partial [Solirubrobacterales bacterium]|nr:hypothetical protein [Solirubrobacterales bacterium]
HIDRLHTPDGEPRLVIAAGGDGTVWSVAGHLATTQNPLGILPLGTGNDFSRSLDGELDGNIPGQFDAVAGALRVIVPGRS